MNKAQLDVIAALRIELEESQATVRVLSDKNAELQADALKATDAAQEALADQAQELARLGAEVQAGEEALLAERRRVAKLEGEVSASESALHVIEDRLRDAGVDSVKGLHDLALEATERAEAAQTRVAELERDLHNAKATLHQAQMVRDGCRTRADSAEAQVSKLSAEAAVMRKALERALAHLEQGRLGSWSPAGFGREADDLRAAIASDAGRALLDEMEGLRKRVAELEAKPRAVAEYLMSDYERVLLRRAEKAEAALATSEGHVIALREALRAQAGDTPGPESRPCWCNEDDCVCRNRSWCVQARAALASPSPQPTHWVPREQLKKLEADLAAMAPVVGAARAAKRELWSDRTDEKEAASDGLDAALAALDARKGGG